MNIGIIIQGKHLIKNGVVTYLYMGTNYCLKGSDTMELQHAGIAGTMESGDIYVEIERGTGGIDIDLNSTVGAQFGKQIKSVIEATLRACGVESATVRAVDKGALDCTIRARITAAALRGADADTFNWR